MIDKKINLPGVGCKNYISQIKMPIYSKQKNKYSYADFEQYDKRIST
jgi:hypothetical protein